MPKVIPSSPTKQEVEPTIFRWQNDFGKHLIKSVTLEIGGTLVAKTVHCKRCHEAFDAPLTEWEEEWQKIYRESDKPDFNLCPECDRKFSEKRTTESKS